jgi:hypothetical protein
MPDQQDGSAPLLCFALVGSVANIGRRGTYVPGACSTPTAATK